MKRTIKYVIECPVCKHKLQLKVVCELPLEATESPCLPSHKEYVSSDYFRGSGSWLCLG